MRLILALLVMFSSSVFALDTEKERKLRTEKQIKKVIEDEAKYAREQVFYTDDNYDFKGSEVNDDSLKTIKVPPVDDLDMDHVYD